MRRIISAVLFGLMAFAITVSPSFANTISANSDSPYDLINSKGQIIKYSDLQNQVQSYNVSESRGKVGSGIVLPEREIPKDPNKPTINFGTGQIIDEDKDSNSFSPFAVIGTDQRTKVTDTTKTPHKQIAYVELEYDNFYAACTGTLIGKDLVLTNAHCVHDLDTGESAVGGVVIPALKDNHYSYGAYFIQDYYHPVGYSNSGDSQYDFAILKLEKYGSYDAGDIVGYLPYKQVTNLSGTTIKIYGYPADLIEETGLYNQWGMSGTVSQESTNLAYYTIDTFNGQSGSAMLNTSNQVVGVHNASYRLQNGNVINGGPKMTKPMVDFITWASLQ